MSIQIAIPSPLRRFTAEDSLVEVQAETVDQVLDKLDEQYPGFRSRLCEDSGKLRRFFNIYLDGEDVRFLDNLTTEVKPGSDVSIIPAIAGG